MNAEIFEKYDTEESPKTNLQTQNWSKEDNDKPGS